MAEPIIGMSFGTYKTLTSQLGILDQKNIEQTNGKYSRYHSGKLIPGAEEEYTQLSMPNKNSNHAEVFGIFGGLIYSGTSNNYNDEKLFADIKYTRIVGQRYYAIDKNGNGKVDEGEILPIDYCCTFSYNDEKTYGLNNTTMTGFSEPKCTKKDM